VAIGAQAALEAVAEALLHGHEELRQAAAEALANHPDEGHPTLQEGATLEDLLVRRAVVFGLRRVRQEWAIEILRRLQLHDEQWVVKNAATQALEEMAQPEPRLPKPIPPLTELPWLIAFAGERGIGVAPGKPAQDLLLLALKEGNEEQRLAALEYLNRVPLEAALSTIYQVYQSAKGEIREAALNTLWLYESIGITTRPV
jgi:HEAT repeat protein